MSGCIVDRLERVFVVGGFRVVCTLYRAGVFCCSSSIYLYIGDVVLRVGSCMGLT